MIGRRHITVSFLLASTAAVLASNSNETVAAGQESSQRNQVQHYIKSLAVVRDKVAPLVPDNTGYPKAALKVNLDVMYIRGANDAEQTVSTALYFHLMWRDEALAWDLNRGVNFIELPSDAIWTPDIIVANSIDTRKPLSMIDTLTVYNNGSIEIKVFMIIETVCPMDHTLFPFDEQTCPIIFYASSNFIQWNLSTRSSVDSKEAQQFFASNWELLQFQSAVMYLPQYHKTVPLVNLTLRRKTLFYSVCLVLPLILTSYMNTLVFLVPLHSGEKVSYLVTIFVSTLVYISFFSDAMPRSLDKMPGSMQLLICVTVESLIYLFATLLILRRFYQEQAGLNEIYCNAIGKVNNKMCQLDSNVRKSEATQLTSRAHDQSSRLNHTSAARHRVVPEQPGREDQLPKAQPRKAAEEGCCKPSAQQLDNVCFALAFIVNTVVLSVILFHTLNVADFIP